MNAFSLSLNSNIESKSSIIYSEFKFMYEITSKIFIESTLRDVFVYKAGAFTYFSALKKCTFLKSMLLPNFAFDVIYTGNNNNSILMMFK